MSFEFNGSFIYREAGNAANTGNLGHCCWVKRLTDFAGRSYLGTIRNNGETIGHQLFVNDAASVAYGVKAQNYGSGLGEAFTGEPLTLNTWDFVVINGSGGNWTVKVWDGVSFASATLSDGGFVIAVVRWGGDGYTQSFPGRIAHLRMANAPYTDAQAQAEMLSATPVRTTGLISAHSGGGGSIAAALTGETGLAYLNGGGVIYSADMPSFDTFTGITITGTGELPGTADLTGPAQRYNRILHSGNLADPVWTMTAGTRVAGAVAAPPGFGTSQRLKIVSGAISQIMTGLPQIQTVAVMAVKRVDNDFVSLRHLRSDFAFGVQGIFNLNTGVWDYTGTVGGYVPTSTETFQALPLANNWWVLWVAATITGDRVVQFAPVASTTSLDAVVGKSIDVCAFQYEDVVGGVSKATYHKPTTSTIVSRSLTSVTAALSSATVGVGQTATLNVQLADNVGDPWDQYGPVDVVSSDVTKVTAASTVSFLTDRSGRMQVTLTGVAAGSSTLTATAGGITSAGVVLTVGTATARFVDIQVEPGWQGTSGWHVAVYEKHATNRFPSVLLFAVQNQAFAAALLANRSRLVVPVPSSVTVTVGQVVEVVIENDNYLGKPVDGPGIFPATVI